jgi:hypothetical protein
VTILGRGDLAPRRRRRRGGLLRVLAALAVVVVLGGAAYGAWRLLGPSSSKPAAARQRCVTTSSAVAPARPGTVRLRVMNTTLKAGLAAKVRRELRGRGFTVVGIGNASPAVHGIVLRAPSTRSTPAEVRALREQFPSLSVRKAGRHGLLALELGKHLPGIASARHAAAAHRADVQAARPKRSCAPA